MRRKSIEAESLKELRAQRDKLYRERADINAQINGITQAIETIEGLVHQRTQRRKLLKADK